MDDHFYKQIVEKIDFIYTNIAKSRNNSLIQKLESKKEQIYKSIPQSSSLSLENKQLISKYLDTFVRFVSEQDNLEQQGFFRILRHQKKKKNQNIFAEKLIKLPKYFLSLESQNISNTGFINDQDVAILKAPVNISANSYKLDQNLDYTVCLTLIFKDIFDEEIFVHSLSAQKLLKKIPELSQFLFLQTLENYLALTINLQKQQVSVQSLNPIVHFSPSLKYDENDSQQQFYLQKDTEIVMSPTYKIKVINIFYRQTELNTNNYIKNNINIEYDNKLLIQHAANYIILQPFENNIDHQPLTIYDLKKSILLNDILQIPVEKSAQITFDGYGFLFEILKEDQDFYTSLSIQGPIQSSTKKINFSLIIKNELRIQFDLEDEQLFFNQSQNINNQIQ